MIPLGLSMALSNGVGNAIGAGDVQLARRLACLALAMGCAVAMAYACVVYALGEPIARFFSTDEAVVGGALAIWPLVSSILVLDALFALSNGLLRGLGLNNRSALCVVLALWCVGLPVILARARSLEDVWMAMLPLYAGLDALLIAAALVRVSWHQLAIDVRERQALSSSDGAQISSSDGAQISSSDGAQISSSDPAQISSSDPAQISSSDGAAVGVAPAIELSQPDAH